MLVRRGRTGVELDVRLSASGDVVVLHDPTLARLTKGRDTRPVGELSWSELCRASSPEKVPRLADAVEWAEGQQVSLNVEIKHDVPHRLRLPLVQKVAREVLRAKVPILVSSFDPLSLFGVRTLAPTLACALLTDPSQAYARALHALARPMLVRALHVERRQALPHHIERWKKRGLVVGVWTVNDPLEARQLVRAGVDILISDEPGRILEAIHSQGADSAVIPAGVA